MSIRYARPAAKPIEQQKRTREKWENAVQRVAYGMRLSIDGNEHGEAEQCGKQAQNEAGH